MKNSGNGVPFKYDCPHRKSKGAIVLGSSVRPSVRRHNLVSATPPTVFKGF